MKLFSVQISFRVLIGLLLLFSSYNFLLCKSFFKQCQVQKLDIIHSGKLPLLEEDNLFQPSHHITRFFGDISSKVGHYTVMNLGVF